MFRFDQKIRVRRKKQRTEFTVDRREEKNQEIRFITDVNQTIR